MQNGKGSSPRNCFSKEFHDNYDEIEWRKIGTYCEDCGLSIDVDLIKNHPDLYIKDFDGHIRHVHCNWN